jgi:PIN domain nuclease of toxin-antitoxin system
MAHKHILDTHALIWYLEGNPRLGAAAKTVMEDPGSEMILPMIALAEAVDIVNKGRTSLPSVSSLISDVTSDQRVEIYPLTFEVLQESLTAGAVPEMHDRLIVATTLYFINLGHQVALLTKDVSIRTSALVPIVW